MGASEEELEDQSGEPMGQAAAPERPPAVVLENCCQSAME